MIRIDGSKGEGGGQILRSALALSMVTGRPFQIEKIRAGRAKPGLMRQHLTAVLAAQKICEAEVGGAEIGSAALTFTPRAVRGGAYAFAVGTAGSCTLVLQTVLPALLQADAPSVVTLEGGTHNPYAPPFDFLAQSFLPLLGRMGATVTARLERAGFYPAGGGRMVVEIAPAPRLQPLELRVRGPILRQRARALVARLPAVIGERELKTLRELITLPEADCVVESVPDSLGPGNVLLLELASDGVTEVITGFGERDVPAEKVARNVAEEARAYLASDVPVGKRLADQLLIPLALAGGGGFRTLPLSRHTQTNMEIISRFLPVTFATATAEDRSVEVSVRK
jgi:RNA 3'-terminal phosphate cyclase (ATP)